MKRTIAFMFIILICSAVTACAADPMSFQTYLNGKSEATTVAPDTDFIPVLQGSFVRRVHPKSLFSSWQPVSYSAGNFSSNTGSWTVNPSDVSTLTYLLQGNTMTMSWYIRDTSVSGSPTSLWIHIPENRISKRLIYGTCGATRNGSSSGCVAQLQTTSPYVLLYTGITGAVPWGDSSYGTSLYGQITFEVQ